jgi:AcrR family transcriptional regulator
MPRKTLDPDIDRLIVETTIHEAAVTPANRFSTQLIAKKLGISEFVIFDHFESKDYLIAMADKYVSVPFYEAVLLNAKKSETFEQFFSLMVDYLLSHPDHNAFAINYCRVFPRYERDVDYDNYKKMVTAMLSQLEPYFPIKNHDDAYFLWARFNRELLSDCQRLIDGKIPDNPRNRSIMASLLYGGLASYRKQ